MEPYVGVTDLRDLAEVEAVISFLPALPPRPLMIGVLANNKTLAGLPNKHPKRFPKIETIADIFKNVSWAQLEDVEAIIHYRTDEPDSLFAQLDQLVELGDVNLDGFQLNSPWPPIEELERFKDKYWEKEFRLILRVGDQIRQESPNIIASRVGEYVGLITDVVIETGLITDQAFDPDRPRQYLDAIVAELQNKEGRRWPFTGIGVTGGLGPSTVHLIEPLLKEFPRLSFDAYEQLRDKKDNFDLVLVKNYFEKAFRLVR